MRVLACEGGGEPTLWVVTHDASTPPEPDLAAQRAALLKNIRRASLAGVLALALVVALAVLTAWQARQSERQAARADAEARRAAAAQADAATQLWKARLNEARATRIAGGPGARHRAASIIADLARDPALEEEQILELRSEVIAQQALLDVVAPTNWIGGDVSISPARGVFIRRRQGPQVEVQDVATSNVVATFSGPAASGHAYFSPQGRFVTVAFKTEPISLWCWRLADGALVFTNPVPEDTFFGGAAPVFSPDDELVAVIAPGAVAIRRLTDGSVVRRRAAAVTVAFSSDGRWLACANGSTIVVEAVADGERRTQLDAGFEVTQLAWRPGADVLGVAGRKGAVSLWELPVPGRTGTGRVRTTDGHNAGIIFAGFLGDGSALVTTGWDGFSFFWEATSGRKVLAESRQYLAEAGSGDTRIVAVRGFPPRSGLAELQPRRGYRVVTTVPKPVPPPVGVKLAQEGRWLALDHVRFTTVVQAGDGREMVRLRGRDPDFSADGGSVFTCDGDKVRRFHLADLAGEDPASGLADGEVFHRTPPGTTANSVSLSPDGRSLWVCAPSQSVIELDATTGAMRRTVPMAAHFARVTPDGDWLVTQMHNAGAHLVRLGMTNQFFRLGLHLNTGFDASARWLAAATEQRLTLLGASATNRWSVRHRIPLQTGAGAPPPFAFSPDGRLLAVVFNRFDVRLYEPDTARMLATFSPAFPAQIQGVAGLVFGADGRELFAAKQDGEVVAWTIPVLRAELARLGLDWGGGRAKSALAVAPPPLSRVNVWTPLAAAAAGLVLLIGVIVFTVQRRTVDAYARAEALAQERQQKLLEAQVALVQSQKLEALGTLAAGLAHDFNNLLSVIRMSNHFVARAVPAEGATRENVQAIEQAVAQGRDIIRSMLGYARRTDDAATEFSVPRAVADTMGMLSRQFLSGLTVSLELEPTCPVVRGSGAQLEQVLLNLVVNAAEAMNGHGRLVVSARPVSHPTNLALQPVQAPAYVELAVRDSGPGMAPEPLARVFEPFFTTKAGRTQPGTGLGLSVVDTIARQSGWGLGVRSRPGEGAEFVVLLPASEPGGEPLA